MSDKIRLIKLASRKLANDREFMTFYLEEFQKNDKINQMELCSLLNCSTEEYYKLALCKAPNVDMADFGSRLINISQYTGISVLGLSQLIKRVNAILAFSEQEDKNYLIAARDKNRMKKDDTKGEQ